jgi:protein dithiol:quinone oxidoreductase
VALHVFTPTERLWGVAALAFGSVGIALVSQYQFDMLPCPWCILQRLIFIVIGVVSLAAALVPSRLPRIGLAGLATAFCVAGMAAALYQKLVASKLQSCAMTLADRLIDTLGVESWWPWLLAVQGSCADAAVDLLGLPYELWALALFGMLGVLLVTVIGRLVRSPPAL